MQKAYIAMVLVAALVFTPRVYASCFIPDTTGVSLKVESSLQQTVASASVGYAVTITNERPTSYDDASLAIEVRDTASMLVVDRFVYSDVSVEPNTSSDTAFVWRTSGALPAGKYMINVVFVPSGTSYGDAYSDARLPRASSEITVASDAKSSAVFAGSIISTGPGGVSIPIQNNSDAPYRGFVTWQIYKGTDASGAPFAIKNDEVQMLPRGSAIMRYDLPDAGQGAYYVEARLSVNNSVQEYAGAWSVQNAISQTNTSCDGADAATIAQQIGLLILAIVILGGGWMYIRKHPLQPERSSSKKQTTK